MKEVLGSTPRRSREERERDYEITSSMYLKGFTQQAIADTIGVSREQIRYDLKVIRKRWLESSVRDFDKAKTIELLKIDAIEDEAWQGWRASQKDKLKTTKQKTRKGPLPKEVKEGEQIEGEGDSFSSQMISESSPGNPKFLEIVLTCVDRRCKLLGFDAPQQIQVSGISYDDALRIAQQMNPTTPQPTPIDRPN